VNGSRKKNDGFSYFGTQLKLNDKVIMDYKLNLDNSKNAGLYVFLIYFKDGKYYIKACRGKLNLGLCLLLVKVNNGYVTFSAN